MNLPTAFSLTPVAGITLACQGRPAAGPTAAPPAAPRYNVRGVFAPGLGGIIAFALKATHGWLMPRTWDGALPSNKIFFSLSSSAI